MSPRRRRLLVLVVLGLPLAWAVSGVAAAWFLTRRADPFEETAPILHPETETLRLITTDGVELGAWFHAGREDLPVVLLLHGRDAARSRNLWHWFRLVDLGAPVLSLTHRGHGDSGGARRGFGVEERQDVLAGLAELERRYPDRPKAIVAVSLGTAATLYAAEDLSDRVQGLFLDSPYVSLERAVRQRCELYLPPLLDTLAFYALWTFAPLVVETEVPLADVRPLDHAQGLAPTLEIVLVNGGADRMNPPEDLALFEARLAGSVRSFVVPGARHGVAGPVDPERYVAELEGFLRRVAR